MLQYFCQIGSCYYSKSGSIYLADIHQVPDVLKEFQTGKAALFQLILTRVKNSSMGLEKEVAQPYFLSIQDVKIIY